MVPRAGLAHRTHGAAAGLADVAIGDALVKGEAEVGPADVAHHLATSPDGLQAKQGHLPAMRAQQGQLGHRAAMRLSLPGSVGLPHPLGLQLLG